MPYEMKEIPGFPGYGADSNGNFWSRWMKKGGRNSISSFIGDRWKQLKQNTRKDGYLMVGLNHNGKQTYFLSHRVILECFKGPCPPGMEARHLNGIRTDNRPENLTWDTHQTNCLDKKSHGTNCNVTRGENHYRAKLTETEVVQIIQWNKEGMSQQRIADSVGVTQANVSAILSGKTWRHVPR